MRSAFLALLLPSLIAAQEATTRVVVTDSLGNRIPFAFVQVRQAKVTITRTADDSGRVSLPIVATDSIALTARRIGYREFEGFVARDAEYGAHRVILERMAQSLDRLAIIAPGENRLFRNGFYGRQEQAITIATSTRFFGPEALESRHASRVSQLLGEIPFLRIGREGTKPFAQGRGRCSPTYLLDGRAMRGLIEEVAGEDAAAEVRKRAAMMPAPGPGQPDNRVQAARRQLVDELQSIDEIISPGSIAALEAYASANQAPPDLRLHARNQACALIVIWTGNRQ